MKGIKEINIDNDRIFLKKNGYLGWSVTNPYKIDGKINWFNLLVGGNWLKFGITIGFVIILLLAIGEYYTILKIANECILNQPQFILGG